MDISDEKISASQVIAKLNDKGVDILKELGINAGDLITLLDMCKGIASLNAPIGEKEDREFGDIVPAPQEAIGETDIRATIDAVARTAREGIAGLRTGWAKDKRKTMSDRLEYVVTSRLLHKMGLPGGKTLQELADELGLTKEGVRVIENAAMRYLKKKGLAKLGINREDYLSPPKDMTKPASDANAEFDSAEATEEILEMAHLQSIAQYHKLIWTKLYYLFGETTIRPKIYFAVNDGKKEEFNAVNLTQYIEEMNKGCRLTIFAEAKKGELKPEILQKLASYIACIGKRLSALSLLAPNEKASKLYGEIEDLIDNSSGPQLPVLEALASDGDRLQAENRLPAGRQANASRLDLKREKKVAVGFRNELIAMAYEAKKQGETIILGLDESWIPKGAGAMPLIKAIDEFVQDLKKRGLDNIIFERGTGDAVALKIQKAQKDKSVKYSNIIVIGEKGILESAEFGKLKGATDEDAALLVGVDAKNLGLISGVRIPEMYLLAMALNEGKDVSALDQTFISIDPTSRKRAFIFTPIKPHDLSEFKKAYDIHIKSIDINA